MIERNVRANRNERGISRCGVKFCQVFVEINRFRENRHNGSTLRTTPNMLTLVVGLRAWFQCKEGLYNYRDETCVTVDECSSIYGDGHAYKIVGYCIRSKFYGKN